MNRPSFLINFSLIFGVLFLSGCNAPQSAAQRQLEAIDKIRIILELPDMPVKFVEMTRMTNSPSGDLQVALYTDSQGRNFSIDPQTDRVVEIDARALLNLIPTDTPVVPLDILRAKAKKIAAATIPNFDLIQAELKYEENGKIDNYFFDWTDTMHPGSFNRTFAQVAYLNTGLLFAYYNTIHLK